MKIRCEHPVLIFNPNLIWLVSCKAKRVVLFDRELDYTHESNLYYNFPWRDFYVAKERANTDNCDQCYCVDEDGVTYPVFMAVPCGKCILCRAHRTSEWETRCMCESMTAKFKPHFITLTYRNDCRPDTMEQAKDDFQRFMKRLRFNVSSLTGSNRELRFLAVSEYTPKNHYIHIHMLLWNMPFITKDGVSSFQALNEFVSDAWQNGFVKVEICRDPSGRYCMKYLRKGADDDSNDCWMLCSRRNGIGYHYAMQYLPCFLKNPDISSICVVDGSGKPTQRAIPSYFKRLWFPTISNLFPNHISIAIKDFMRCATNLRYYYLHIPYSQSVINDIIQMVGDVSDKFSQVYKVDFNCALPSRRWMRDCDQYLHGMDNYQKLHVDGDNRVTYWYVNEYFEPCQSLRPYGDDFEPVLRPNDLSQMSTQLFAMWSDLEWSKARLQNAYRILMNYNFDLSYILNRLSVTLYHQEYLHSIVGDMPEVDVDHLVYLEKRDMEWRETHWMQNPET